MQHEKKLQDFFADAKVPRDVRARLPLVVGVSTCCGLLACASTTAFA
jgi:hypothetical protein